jgi:hypothetical protein
MRRKILTAISILCLGGVALVGMGAVIVDGKTDTFREIQEVDRHIHSRERWFGAAATPAGEAHVADSVSTGSTTAFQPDAGNDDFGAWGQALGSADTPAITGMTWFDPHQIFVTAAERNTAIYVIQVGWGASGAAALAAGAYTEVMFKPPGATFISTPTPLKSERQMSGAKVWVRIKAVGQNTGTLNMFLGIHEYPS